MSVVGVHQPFLTVFSLPFYQDKPCRMLVGRLFVVVFLLQNKSMLSKKSMENPMPALVASWPIFPSAGLPQPAKKDDV